MGSAEAFVLEMWRLASLVSACLIIAKTVVAEAPAAAEDATEVGAPLNCKSTSYAYCCEFGVPCDCSQGSTASGQCEEASYAFCCGVGTPCDCSAPPLNVTV